MQEPERRLAGIVAADVVGYSRLLGQDEAGTLARVRALRAEVIEPQAATHAGRLFKTTGDGFLLAFPSAVQALRCALAIQAAQRAEGALMLRIGVHQGEVIPDGDDLQGDGIVIAARLEPLAEPGGIALSARVREDAMGKVAIETEDLGTPALKNIAQPIQVFRVRPAAPERPALALPDKPSLVVLPFQNMSGDPEQEYFADGMVEDITTALSRIGGLFVIARNSAFTYKGKPIDVKAVGRELGVRYVVEGSVRKAGGRVRITAQLIEAASASHLWAERFDGPLDDVFDLQDRVTEQIAGALEGNLHRAEIRHALAKPTESLNAYDLYYRAMDLSFHDTRDDLAQAVTLARDAIAADPGFVRARALAASLMCSAMLSTWLQRDEAAVAECIVLAKSALRDAADDAEILARAGFPMAYLSDEPGLGHAAVERAMRINPNSPVVLWAGAACAMMANRPGDLRERCLRAIRLSPLDPNVRRIIAGLALADYDEGKPADGLVHARRLVEMNPNGHHAHGPLIYCLVALGRIEEAREVARDMALKHPGETISHNLLHLQAFTPEQRERRLNALRIAGIPE